MVDENDGNNPEGMSDLDTNNSQLRQFLQVGKAAQRTGSTIR